MSKDPCVFPRVCSHVKACQRIPVSRLHLSHSYTQEHTQRRNETGNLDVALSGAKSRHSAQEEGKLRMAHGSAVLATPFEACASHITINQVDALDCELRRLDEVEHLGVVGPAELKPVADGQRPHLPPHRRWDPRAPQGVHPLFADVRVKGRQYFLE